jgi:outer membrane protein OmpA-like peptidoglycan-associated protein
MDDGQGFADISTMPATFGVGLGGHAEVFGAWSLVTRIDHDTRPLFFTSTAAEQNTGTGGGLIPGYPLNREGFASHLGEFWVGGKFNFMSELDKKPAAVAVRAMIKFPTGSKEPAGTTSGQTDFLFDGIVSKRAKNAEVSGYGGYIWRGNPSGYSLTNGFRWGFGAEFPNKDKYGIKIVSELFGEAYSNKTITAPIGLIGTDQSFVPLSTSLKNPVIWDIGLTWQASNGFYVGTAWSWNLTMDTRDQAIPLGFTTSPYQSTSKDNAGWQFRIGFHPGVRSAVVALPPPPPPPPPPPAAPPPAAAPNRNPTVRASCDPCTVEVGKTSTVTADAQDPDGDPLTYRWTTGSGTLSSPTNRQTPWIAPNVEGPVRVTVTVSDGKGGTATDTVTINVIRPAAKTYTFEDVHFDFDRFTLRPDALRVLDEAVTAMQADPNLKLTIEGHTCNIGTAEYNLALGERRAQAVKTYLTGRGIAADRLTTVSYGEERPKYDNSREETRRLNRRAQLTVRLQYP